MSENTETEGVVFDPFDAPTPRKTVVLARAYTDADGTEHKADKDIELDRDEADRLLNAGLARTEEQDAAQRAELDAAAPAAQNIPDVLAAVGDDKDKAQAALEAEKAGKNRPSLIKQLEAIVNTNPEGN